MRYWNGLVVVMLCGLLGCSRGPVSSEEPVDAGSSVEEVKEVAQEPVEEPTPDAGVEPAVEPPPEREPPKEPEPPQDTRPIPKYPQDGLQATVVHITDGDTLYLVMQLGGWASRVRLKGVNAPECYKKTASDSFQSCSSDKEYYGLQAYKVLKDLLSGAARRVIISCTMKGEQCEKDDFDRFLVYLKTPDGKDVGETIVRKGAVFTFTRYQNSKVAEYCQAEADAIRTKAGMWDKGRSYIKQKMSNTVRAWYYNHKPNHDSVCSTAMKKSFAKAAGE